MHVISNYLVNALTHKFRADFMNIEAATGQKKKAPVHDPVKKKRPQGCK